MEPISYTSGMIWYFSWPVLIYITYKFVSLNIDHFDKNLNNDL